MIVLKVIFALLICIPFIYFLFSMFKKFVEEVLGEGKEK